MQEDHIAEPSADSSAYPPRHAGPVVDELLMLAVDRVLLESPDVHVNVLLKAARDCCEEHGQRATFPELVDSIHRKIERYRER